MGNLGFSAGDQPAEDLESCGDDDTKLERQHPLEM